MYNNEYRYNNGNNQLNSQRFNLPSNQHNQHNQNNEYNEQSTYDNKKHTYAPYHPQTMQSIQRDKMVIPAHQFPHPDQEYTRNARLEPNLFLEDSAGIQRFPDVYAPRQFLQAPQKNLVFDPDDDFLSIDSADRDRTKYMNPFSYTIPLVGTSDHPSVTGKRYKNVYSIELVSAILPNVDEITSEMYIILEIKELMDVGFDASNSHLKGAFAKMVMCECLNDNFVILDADNSRPLIRVFYPSPKASLDKFTITIKKPNGEIIDLGPDNDPDQEPIKGIQNSFTFKIISKVVDTSPLGHRNV